MEDKIKQKKLYLFYFTFNSLPLSIFAQTKYPYVTYMEIIIILQMSDTSILIVIGINDVRILN